MTKWPVRMLAGLLGCLSALACLGGCIPIGVRGSTMAGTEPSRVAEAQSAIATPSPMHEIAWRPSVRGDATREHDPLAARRCV
jgi:hypothetical protein